MFSNENTAIQFYTRQKYNRYKRYFKQNIQHPISTKSMRTRTLEMCSKWKEVADCRADTIVKRFFLTFSM